MNNKQAFNVATVKQENQEERYLSVKTVSEMFDIKQDTIRKWIAKRYLPSFNIRGLVRVRFSDVESMLSRKPSKEEAAKKLLKVV
jgi:excisionase family DNA binding protein